MTPDGWQDTVLARIVAGDDGLQTGPFGGQLHAAEYTSHGVPVVMPKDLSSGRIVTNSIARIPEELAMRLARHRVSPGDILFGRRGDIGRCGLVAEQEVGWLCGTGCLRARLDPRRSHSSFLIHLITWSPSVAWLTDNAVGQTMLNLSTGILGRFPLRLPPLDEQRKIAAILSSVDDAIEATQAVIDQLQVVKKAIMTELLTRGLPGRHTRFKQTEIGEVPEEWEVLQMDALSAPKGMVGGPFGSDLTAKDYVPMPGVPVIRGGNVSMGRFNEEDFVFVSREKADELAKNAARPGDLVMTQRGASLGEVTLLLADCGYEFYIISQTMMRMTPDSSKISPRFLLHYTCSAAAQKWLQGHQIATGQPHLNLGIYREMPALVPGRHEQEAIAAVMDHLHDAQNSNVPQLEQLKLVKSALMSVLFAGEVRVTPDEAAG